MSTRRGASTQVAASVPFNPSGLAYVSNSVQDVAAEIRRSIVYDPTVTAATASGTKTLTQADDTLQVITGTAIAGYSVVLPDATTLFNGRKFDIVNSNTLDIAVKDGTGALLFNLPTQSVAQLTLQSNSTSAGVWIQVVVSTVATGILNFKLTSSTPFTTTSTTDVPITGFSITPSSGTYVAMYNADVLYTTTPRYHYYSYYVGGVKVTTSERRQITSRSNQGMSDSLLETFTVNGSQAVDVRVRTDVSGGSLTVNARTLVLIRLGV